MTSRAVFVGGRFVDNKPETTTEILASSRKELRERKVIDITHYLRVRTAGAFTQELLYMPEYVLLEKRELTGLLDELDRLDPPRP